MINIYPVIALTGGAAGALDALDGDTSDDGVTPLADGDGAVHFQNGVSAGFYILVAASGATDDGYFVIAPDTNAGTKRWIRQSVANINQKVVASDATLAYPQTFGGLINNYNQAGATILTLPTIAQMMYFTVILTTTVAAAFTIQPDVNDSIYLDGVTTGDHKNVSVASAAIGNAIQFIAIQTGASSYDWFATTIAGSWAAEA